jgi:solute:Na+ symporter, SSS family
MTRGNSLRRGQDQAVHMHLSLLDVFIIILYAVLVLAIGQFFQANRGANQDDRIEEQPKRRRLPWWVVGTSLIAANISAEQIIGMSGSAYAMGLAIATYEWTAALVILIVGKYFLPIFLKNQIDTMPGFLRRRYGSNVQMVMAVFWLLLYIFVNLTAVLWLGAMAVHTVAGLSMTVSLILLGLFAGNYALYVGLRVVPLTSVVQVSMLVLGGLIIVVFALNRIAGGGGIEGLGYGLATLAERLPEHFHMILKPDNPFYKYAPGVAMVAGGMWIVHMCYWGFNQNISQRALETSSLRETQHGMVLAAFLKLLIPVLVVLPGIAAVPLVSHMDRPDEAYPMLMTMLPEGLLGFVFVALVAAIIVSMGSTLSSVATIFSRDVVHCARPQTSVRALTISGWFAAIGALVVAMLAAIPLLQGVDQAFQYIQEYTAFLTPGVLVIFLAGMFWKRATEAGALAAAVGSPLGSLGFKLFRPDIPFLNRVSYIFVICIGLIVVVSMIAGSRGKTSTIEIAGIDYSTSRTYNIAFFLVIAILVALYAIWW